MPAAAQDSPNAGDVHVSGAVDVSSAYFFRGIRQETQGYIIQPYLDLGVTLFKGEGTLKAFTLNVGTWNSLHNGGLSGSHNQLNHKIWYESDFYATIGFLVNDNVNVGMTYTAYTSPNSQFTTVKELSWKFSIDDSPWLGKYKQYAAKPYVLLAQEFDTGTGTGQADGGFCQGTIIAGCAGQGTYLEVGGAPSYTKDWWTIAVPLKLGIGLIDYYQALYIDPVTGESVDFNSKFGFFSVGLQGTVPFSPKPTRFGNWNVHGGIEWLTLGDMATYANQQPAFYGAPITPGGGLSNEFVVSVGVSFSY
jgi:hypothetical protein